VSVELAVTAQVLEVHIATDDFVHRAGIKTIETISQSTFGELHRFEISKKQHVGVFAACKV
jgi:hypothetical protein